MDPERVKEAIIFKRYAFIGVSLATFASILTVVMVPMVYMYLQMIQTNLREELDFCRHQTDNLWDEYGQIQKKYGRTAKLSKRTAYDNAFRSKRQSGYDATPVVDLSSTTVAPAGYSQEEVLSAPNPVKAEESVLLALAPASTATKAENAGYETAGVAEAPTATTASGVTPTPNTAKPVPAAASEGPKPVNPWPTTSEVTYDGKGPVYNREFNSGPGVTAAPPQAPPITHIPIATSHDVCSCGVGAAGPPGSPGPDGLDGKDGEAGTDGKAGLDGTVDIIHNSDNFCFDCPPAVAGPAGLIGPKGESGRPGLPGPDGTPGKPGFQGLAGPAGAPGSLGKAGKSGETGKPGVVNEVQGDAAPAGPPGPPGIPGQDGLPGPLGKDGLPGPIGPSGDSGKDGVPGAAGTQGDVGLAGETGSIGGCSDCPLPRTAPGY